MAHVRSKVKIYLKSNVGLVKATVGLPNRAFILKPARLLLSVGVLKVINYRLTSSEVELWNPQLRPCLFDWKHSWCLHFSPLIRTFRPFSLITV